MYQTLKEGEKNNRIANICRLGCWKDGDVSLLLNISVAPYSLCRLRPKLFSRKIKAAHDPRYLINSVSSYYPFPGLFGPAKPDDLQSLLQGGERRRGQEGVKDLTGEQQERCLSSLCVTPGNP